MTRVFLTALIALFLAGCSENMMARNGLGKMMHHMPCGERLLNVTWKGEDAQFWVLSRPLAPDEVPQTYRFKATTSYGFFEGEVIIMESLCK